MLGIVRRHSTLKRGPIARQNQTIMQHENAVIYEAWLRKFAAESERLIVRDSEAMIGYFFDLTKGLPNKYGWRVMSVDAFRSETAKRKSPEELNSLYWGDTARNIEAYDLMVVWRTAEILSTAVTALNQKKILPSAMMARGLLELATTVIMNLNTVVSTIDQVLSQAAPNVCVTCEDIERLLLRMIHGTRLGEPPEHLKQTNVLTHLQRLSKNPNAAELLPTYEYLCEVAHPNVVGNARFWGVATIGDQDGISLVSIERDAEFVTSTRVRESVLWALGWSAVCVRNGFEMGQSAVAKLLKRWPQ